MARPGKVPFATKLCFGLGQIGEATFMSVTLTFAGLYYNQALRLNVSLVGWALALAVLFDAVSDPAVGALSDRWRSRLGRPTRSRRSHRCRSPPACSCCSTRQPS